MSSDRHMKQIKEESAAQSLRQIPLPEVSPYDFETMKPPILTERMLRRKWEEEHARRQALVVTVAGVVTQLILLVAMVLLYEYMPTLALMGIGYVTVSVAAGLVTAVVYVERRGTTG